MNVQKWLFPSIHLHLLKGAFSSTGTHPHRLLPLPAPVGPIMATIIDALLSFASQMCHTLPEGLTVLCPEQVNRNCSRECLYCFFQLSLCLAVCLLNLTSPPSWLGGVSTAVSAQHSSYATWQKIMCQHILGAFSPHSVSCVDLKIGELNY